MYIVNWFLRLLVFCICINTIYGSHFQAGSISYKVIGNNGSKLIVRITQSYTYVYPKIYCNNTLIASQQTLALAPYADATATLNCIASCGTSGGYTPIPVAIKCTDYSVGMSITVGQRTDDVPIDNGSYFQVAYQGSAWRSLNLSSSASGSPQNWSIAALIDLRMRSDGTYNTPPVATMISPIYIPVGVQQTISIPTIDDNNDNVRCRFASGAAECSSVCPPASLPSGTTISSNCSLTITGAVAGDWYSVAVQVEDFANSTTTTPYSSVPVQFLVHVYSQPACTQRPYLYGSSPDGSCTAVQVGVPYTLLLITENYCYNSSVTMVDIATQSFPIVIKSPIVQNTTSLWSVTLKWTPTANQVGSQVFCSVGIDSQNVQTNQYCLTFKVGNGTLGTCPGEIITTTEELTTEPLTTEAPTTEPLTTVPPTTEPLTTVPPTTEPLTTESPTTEPITTTTTIQNTTTANTTVVGMTVVIVSVIIIPICCCCCWCLVYCIRPCCAADVEREKKPVTTYMIEGSDANKGSSKIGEKYKVNKTDDSNSLPTADTSFKTLSDGSLYMEPLSSKSLLTMDNDGNLSLPLSRKNVPVTLDTTNRSPFPLSSSIPLNPQAIPNSNGGQRTTNYDRYPLSQIPTRAHQSDVPASIDKDISRYNIKQPADPLHFASSSLLKSRYLLVNSEPLESDVRKTATPLKKHPRWVVRLSRPREVHSVPLPGRRPLSREQPPNNLSSLSRSIATIPRYAFFPGQ